MTKDFVQGIVEVFGQQGEIGTGFVLTDNLIVTCARVVGSPKAKPSVVFYGTDKEVPVTVLTDLWRSKEQGTSRWCFFLNEACDTPANNGYLERLS